MTADVAQAAQRLAAVLEREDFAGWDPYDALASPLLRATARTPWLRRLAIQALKRSPVNPRRLLLVPRQQHAKALALLASAWARLATAGAADGGVTVHLADRLLAKVLPGANGLGWGYDFDVQTRWGFYRRGEANAVVTAFAMDALNDVAAFSGETRFAEAAARAATFAHAGLLVGGDQPYFSYYVGSRARIHNASALVAAAILRSTPLHTAAAGAAVAALDTVADAQRQDGSWPYGEGPGLEWVDGFHTAYVLTALAGASEKLGGDRWRECVERGLDLYLTRLVDLDGAPRATIRSRLPIDIHAASSGITCLCRLSHLDERALPAAARIARWTLAHMRRRDGRFAFQRHATWRNSVAYVRWSDAHMLLALAEYLTAAS